MVLFGCYPWRVLVALLVLLCNSTSAQLYRNHWSVTDKLNVVNGDDRDRLGVAVDLDGDTLVVGADGDDDRGSTAGAVYVYRKNGRHYRETQKLLALDGGSNDIFGSTVSLIANQIIAIGAPQQNGDGLAPDQGAVYLFRYNEAENKYKEAEKLVASDGAELQNFGFSVHLVNNETLLVGAPGDTVAGSATDKDIGAFYVFTDKEGSGTFTEQAVHRPADPSSGQRFGNTIAAQGNFTVVGSFRDNDNGFESGSAHVYQLDNDGTNYTFLQKLVPNDGLPEDEYGYAIAVEGTTLAVGAHLDNDNFIGKDAGSVYMYQYNGTHWKLETKLTRTTIRNRWTGRAKNEFFGFALSLSQGTLAVGAPGANSLFADNAGVAYIYKRSKRNNKWKLDATLNACEQPKGDNFGYSVDADMTVDKVVVGALSGGGRNNADDKPGAAFVYQRKGFSFRIIRQILCRFFY